MDEDNGRKKPKTFVSTFQLALKPKARPLCVETQREDEPVQNNSQFRRNNGLKAPSATAFRLRPVQAVEKPRFKHPLGDCVTLEGSNATLQGVITGSQPLTISWQHNGQPELLYVGLQVTISCGKRVHSITTCFKNGVASLILTQCSPGDAGTYTCTAENIAGKQSSSAVLHVTAKTEITRTRDHGSKELYGDAKVKVASADNRQLFPASKEKGRNREKEDKVSKDMIETNPQSKVSSSKGPPVEFVDPPEQVEVRVGEQARLHCEFRSSCFPVACCWIYNKEKVVDGGPRMSVSSSETQSNMEISQACPNDNGSYTVIVRNRKGSAQHTVSFIAIDRPDPPASQPVVCQLSTQSLVLSWTGPSYDGGTAVLGYIVEVRPAGPNETGSWTEVASRCKSTCYRVRSGLEPLGQYRFRVRAYNSVGASEPSQESGCIKMETAKEGKKEEQEPDIPMTIETKSKVRDHYVVHERLGVGKFGIVFRLSHKETDHVCAGKFYRARTSKAREAALQEVEIMKCLRHKNLVHCMAAYNTPSEMVMVMEYIAGGELFERIVDDSFDHTEPTCARYMQQILEGMRYVHKQNIVHLDLKPENIVCVDTMGTQIKIIDFGLASKLVEDTPLLVMHGTPEFVAPEVINYEPVGLETDMWSIGVICFTLLSGECPFSGDNDAETLALVTTASYEFDQESFEDISDQAKDFINSLLKKDWRCRLSCAEALVHPWMISFTPLTRRPTKSLNKGKMKHFLAKRKWKKAGKAVLALQRMANLSYRPDSPGSSSEEPGWSQEAEEAIQSLEKQLQSEPRFKQALKDTTLPKGATALLMCLINGFPQPEVKWIQNDKPVSESCRVIMEQDEDGLCTLSVSDLEHTDSGLYVCRASNKLGEAMCSAKLQVEI